MTTGESKVTLVNEDSPSQALVLFVQLNILMTIKYALCAENSPSGQFRTHTFIIEAKVSELSISCINFQLFVCKWSQCYFSFNNCTPQQ